jgi:hypothetical protein
VILSDYQSSPTPPAPQTYLFAVGDKTQGPFDLVELAAQLRYQNIGPATLIQRCGEVAWTPLQDLPEYRTLHDIPVETIARHLEEKERENPAPSHTARIGSDSAGLQSIAILVAVALGLVLLLTLFEGGASAPRASGSGATPADAWIKTEGVRFSIECPVLLSLYDASKEDPSRISEEAYHAIGFGYMYQVNVVRLPTEVPDSMYASLTNGLRDRLLADGKDRVATSQHFVAENGYTGLDVFFTDTATKYDGGFRVLAGNGRLVYATCEIEQGKLKPGEIARFLSSFVVK